MDKATEAEPDHSNRTVQSYVPESRFDAGPLTALKALVKEQIQYRSHIATLFGNAFKSSYRGTVLGVFWNIVLPLVPISVYLLLVTIRVFPSYDGMNPALFLGFNVMLWYLFTGLITRPISVVKSQASTAMKTSVPLSASIASSFAELCFDTLVRFCLIVGLVVAFQAWPSPNPIFILSLAIGLIFCAALGFAFSIINIVYTDTQRLVGIVFQYGLFLSGVIFPVSAMGPLSILEVANPLCVFIMATRDYLFLGHYPHLDVLLYWGIASVALFFFGVRFFYVMEHRIRGMV